MHDHNAIKVIVTEEPFQGFHIGYIRRQIAEIYAPLLDDGRLTVDEAWLIDVNPDRGEAEISVGFSASPKNRKLVAEAVKGS
jgi:hypothetical protein